MQTRGGQGTADINIISSTRPEFYEPHIWTLTDINHETRIHLVNLLRDMEKNRHKNAALAAYKEEREGKKRPAPIDDEQTEGPTPAPKRVTIKEVMSEQQMFQEEHLKLAREHHQLKKIVLSLNSRLSVLEDRIKEHLDDTAFALRVENTISSLGVTQTPELEDASEAPLPSSKVASTIPTSSTTTDWDCNCPDKLPCALHPKTNK